MSKTLWIIVLCLSLCFSIAFADNSRNLDQNGQLTVPFKLERNKVIIPTRVNGSEPLKLILDTGMGFDGVYLFHRELADRIDTTGAIIVHVPGAGEGEPSTAVMIETGMLNFGDVTIDNQRVIIAQSEHTQGFPTDGIIGWSLFGHYAVEIDYNRELITLHDTAGFTADSIWHAIPITMQNNLPFFEGTVEVNEDETVPMTMYIDLASSDALELLTGPNQKFTTPDSLKQQYLATGLSGDIHGSYGVSHRLEIDRFVLTDIPTAFAPEKVRSKQKGADAILGNGAINRFNIIFDYSHNLLHLRPSKFYTIPFE